MKGQYSNIKIAGIASAVPTATIDNMSFIRLYDERKVKKQIKMTGIEKLHVCKGLQKESDLCREAAKRLIEHLGWNPKDICILLFCTQTSDYSLPSTAIDLTTQLGMPKSCMAFDINLGCSAFDLGIQTAAGLLQSQPEHSKAIVLMGDKAVYPSGVTKRSDIMANTMMFGAGGGAAALEKAEGNVFTFANYCDGEGYDAIIRYPLTKTQMNGNRVFDFSINDVSNNLIAFLKDNDLSIEEIDGFFFHQAQKLIVDCIADTCKLPSEKVFTSYTNYGNTSGASVPITICHCKDRVALNDSATIISCGFGVGLSMGISYYRINKENILPIIETDECFKDHIKRHGFLYNKHSLLINPKSEVLQSVARQLDRKSCKLDMVGEDEIVKTLHSQFVFKDGSDYCSIDELLGRSNAQYNAIVVELCKQPLCDIKDDIKRLNEKGLLIDNASCIILADKKEYDRESLLCIMDEVFGCIEPGIRICILTYDSDTMDFYPKITGNLDWNNKRLFEDDTDDMVRAVFLSGPIIQFLMDGSDTVAKELVDISGTTTNFD